MKNKTNPSPYLAAGILATVLYIVFAAKPLEEEFQFVPEWKIDVANPTVINDSGTDEKTHRFRLGQTMGYFTDSGKITNFITFPFKAAISDDFYASYTSNSTGCDLFSRNGTKIGRIDQPGFPMLADERIFVFLPGGNSLASVDQNGNLLWEFESPSPITAFDSSKSGCALGFADGGVVQFDSEGKIIQRFSPGGSELQVILGAAISSDGKLIATVSGQNKERFVLSKREDAHSRIIFHEFSKNSMPYQKLVKFSKDASKVFYDFDGSLGIVDTQTCKSKHIKIIGQAISLEESDRCVFLLTKKGDDYRVYIVENNSSLVGSFAFKAKTAFIKADDENLFVGKDTTISKLKILSR